MRLRNLIVVGSTFVSLSTGARALGAQIEALPTEDQKGPKVHRPTLDPVPNMPGWKGAVLQGTTNTTGHRFIVPSLDVMQPVGVLLVPLDPSAKLTLKVFKDDFEKPLKESSTNGSAPARLQVRTQGPLRLTVSSAQGTGRYQLLMMVGSEIKPPVPSLFVPISMAGKPAATAVAAPASQAAADDESGKSGGSNPVLWIIAGALLLIVAMLGMMLMRRNSAGKTPLILLAIAISGASASYLSAQQQPLGYDVGEPEKVPMKEVVSQEAVEWIEWLVKKQSEQAAAILELFEALTPKDEELEPKYAGMPGIPTACVSAIPKGTETAIGDVDWSGPCGDCFAQAHDSVASTLMRFEKLRRMNAQTKEVYEKSLAFGDAMSGVGGFRSALQWQKIRMGITEQMNKYYQVYDDKVEELSADLVSSMKTVAACEDKYFNNPSWYDRYGFMFVTPVVDRHRR